MAAEVRVAIAVRPLDRALNTLRIALVPLLVLVTSLQTLRLLLGPPGDVRASAFVAGMALAVSAGSVLLVQTEPIGGRLNRFFARGMRRLAMACNHAAGAAHDHRRLGCLLTAEVFRAPLFTYKQQGDAVSVLAGACSAGEPGQYWFVQGESGSGKSRAGLLLVQTLVRDSKLFELGTRCLLYDFCDSETRQNELRHAIGKRRHDGRVVIVDNFHLVRPDVLRALTDALVDNPYPIPERLVVFLARPQEGWNLSPGTDVQLLSQAKAASRFLELRGPQSDDLARRVFEIDPDASQLIRDLQGDDTASGAQLHMAQVIARKRAAPPEVLTALRLLCGISDTTPSDELARVIAIVAALSMHRGSFSPRELRRAVRIVGRTSGRRARGEDAVRILTTFRRLHKIGFLQKVHRDHTRYMFHEAVAELCIDRLITLEAFERAFIAVGRIRLRELEASRDHAGRWLAATEMGDEDAMRSAFDAALSRGSYTRMERCLRRARDHQRYDLAGSSRLQLAILLDRVGKFAASRAIFSEGLDELLDSESDLAVMLAAGRVEASHDETGDVDTLCKHPDRLVVIVGQYWKLHMAAHRGHFDSDGLLALAAEARQLISSRPTHWTMYSLGRMHFDSLRHHYLSGESHARAVRSPERRKIGEYLRGHIPTYEALDALYTRAHVVGHVLLPQVALFNRAVTSDDAALAGLELTEISTEDRLVVAAQNLYRHARDEFWRVGDREAGYLQADILNVEMIENGVDLESFKVRLTQYEEFIAEAGFDDLASYPHFYWLRWHMLKFYAVLAEGRSDAGDRAGEHLAAARRHVRQIVELDHAVGNEYGLMRAEFLTLLLDATDVQLEELGLPALQQRMADRGYDFEKRLLARLQQQVAVRPTELRALFRFYPFVQQ